MASRNVDGIEWIFGDVREMNEIPTGSVDVAFDKGTLDAMIYGSVWSPPDDVKDNARRYVKEVRKACFASKEVTLTCTGFARARR
jgi:hypothetical protein